VLALIAVTIVLALLMPRGSAPSAATA